MTELLPLKVYPFASAVCDNEWTGETPRFMEFLVCSFDQELLGQFVLHKCTWYTVKPVLTLKAPITTVADDISSLIFFER